MKMERALEDPRLQSSWNVRPPLSISSYKRIVWVSMSRVWKGLVKIGRKRAGYTAVTHASWVV